MNWRSARRIAVLSGCALSFVAGDYAAGETPAGVPAAAMPKGHYQELNKLPDWGGIWTIEFPGPGTRRETPQLKGKYLTDYQAWQKDAQSRNGVAKRTTSNCTPPGMPYLMAVAQYPIEFLFTPGRVTTHHEAWMQWRVIYTDGRSHADIELSFNGHSTGKWEGDTLVVDTVGIKPTVPLGPGMFHSDKLHIVERMRLDPKSPDRLLIEITVDDPEALEKPYRNTLNFNRSRNADLLEFICAENDRNPVDSSGETLFDH